jgi:hypothetical protein
VCPDGHFAVTERVERCPFCDEPNWQVDDLASCWAVQRAVAIDADVKFVRSDAADLLRAYAVGAVLRYT